LSPQNPEITESQKIILRNLEKSKPLNLDYQKPQKFDFARVKSLKIENLIYRNFKTSKPSNIDS
jgi:hypothetical protein